MTTAARDGAVVGLWFDGQRYFPEDAEGWLTGEDDPAFAPLRGWLDRYFAGEEPGEPPKLAPEGTAFYREVWRLLMEIPYGATVSYGEIASRVGAARGGRRTSARAVGGAVGRNPVSILIPCHRVVGADGSLTGYGGGLGRKEALLALEARGNGIQD
jgi:methylated-DNA-[protein]-cysteine S-methyltransferase